MRKFLIIATLLVVVPVAAHAAFGIFQTAQPVVTNSFLLLEDSSFLLLEDGSKLVLE